MADHRELCVREVSELDLLKREDQVGLLDRAVEADLQAFPVLVPHCDGNVLEEDHTIANGAAHEVDICLPPSDGYVVTAGGGSWASEISWSLLNPDGDIVSEGSGEGEVTTCPPPPVCGEGELADHGSWAESSALLRSGWSDLLVGSTALF